MLEIRDTEAGLSLKLEIDPNPRDPRLVDDSVFQVVTWTRGLGDAHAWASPADFHAAITSDMAVIVPLARHEGRHGPYLAKSWSDDDRIAGYAFATHERLCLAFGLDEITETIREDIIDEAETVCMGELASYENFLAGEVYRLEVTRRGRGCVERRRDLYGEDFARHIAQVVFDQHLYSLAMNG